MSNDREVMQQALCALKLSTPEPRTTDDDYTERGWKEHSAAITALRAALEEPEPFQPDWSLLEATQESLREHMEEVRQLREQNTMLDAKLGELEAVAEPVAWRITDGEGDWEYRTNLPEDWSIQWSARYGRKYEPLYTAPPQRKPLTDEEIDKITVQQWGRGFLFPAAGRAWVRAIERAHGIVDKE